ncbi:isopentenyl-diphosphate Delta-isomerase [Sphingobacterium pedocola]|uniref:Isopentenyl-diphosphate delta-isomerase n=1 Tax=Sphingobacterium pedocola TaxID=2082722 RepID=A0ABR9T717_9SPHI|nr:isopentenyl-diphosphate Delta-isomerase [Sphingobacterium pedocola]MBE8721138.1 isopentenyl-diphosphate delta-isomerase [Sphingobacterium pedocola]
MERNSVVLVDREDAALGEMDKMEAHRLGVLHRAFSIFIFNGNGDMLIHQRAKGKYHGAGLWTNACCSHPQWDEDIAESAKERLVFEMGLSCSLEKAFSFIYNIPVENNLIEHEYDHVFYGYTDVQPDPNPAEIQNYRWISLGQLEQEVDAQPQDFTYWFKMALKRIIADFTAASN